MDPELHQAASKGDIQRFERVPAEELNDIVMILTGNTILHTNIIFQDPKDEKTIFVEQILRKCPSLLLKVNADGDTALHFAAKFGCVSIIKVLIEHAKDPNNEENSELELPIVKQMLRMTNNDGNTALHLAVQFDNWKVAERLIEEDREYMYPPNSYVKPPLFIAVERDLPLMVKVILDGCSSIAYEGPDGMTALHKAASQTWGDYCMKRMLEKFSSLTKATDNKGWTPLHHAIYAEYFYIASCLLEHDASAACIPDRGRKMTPLHIAAGLGNVRLMDLIVSNCRECCEMVDNRGWNYLHFAALSLSIKELKDHVEANPLVSSRLMNQMDTEGNAPFHLCASLHGTEMSPILQIFGPRMIFWRNKQNQSIASLGKAGGDPKLKAKLDIEALEQEGLLHVTKVEYLPRSEEILKEMNEANKSQLVVAALVATVTFAAAFTLPGGYESEKGPTQGFAILRRSPAFQAFVISDAFALLLSTTAIIIQYSMTSIESVFKSYRKLFVYATLLTMIAMAAMILAFVTGTYAVLVRSLWLAIVTLVLGLSFFGIVTPLMFKVIKRILKNKKEMEKLKVFVGEKQEPDLQEFMWSLVERDLLFWFFGL